MTNALSDDERGTRLSNIGGYWRKADPDSGDAALLPGTLTVFDTVLMVV